MPEVITTTVDISDAIRTVFSREIIRQATPKLRFAQFAKYRDDLQQSPGGSINFTKFNKIAQGGKLTEGVSMSEKPLTSDSINVSVDEYGNAVKVSEKAINQSTFNVLQEAAEQLSRDCALVLDTEIRDSALTTSNMLYGAGRDNAAALVADDGLTTEVIKDAVEQLETANAPKFDGQYYICVCHPHQIRQLKADPDWIHAHQYSGIEQIYYGEIGMYEGVRFVVTTQMPHNTAAESLTKYGVNIKTWEAVIFGENSFAWAEALPVEMRDNGVEDYGRKHGLAWYAIWGFGLIEESNIYKILTA